MEGIPILLMAIDKYSPSATLTAIHCDLTQARLTVQCTHVLPCVLKLCVCTDSLQLCLMAKNLKPALPYLEREYTSLFTEVCVLCTCVCVCVCGVWVWVWVFVDSSPFLTAPAV